MSGLIDNPQLTFDDLSSVETHQEEFGKDKTLPRTPKVIGKSKAEEWVRSLKEKQRAERKTQGQVTLTGGASTAHRLAEFEIYPEKITLAESLGEKAFKNGIIAPAHDKEFLKIIEGSKVGETKPYLEAWNKGWTKANLHDTRPVHTEPKTQKKSEVDEIVENIMERVRAAKTVKEAAKLNQELNLLSFKHNIPQDKLEKVYSLIRATIERLYQEKELKEAHEKAKGEAKPEPKPEPKKEEPKQDIEVTLINRIKAAKAHAELQEVAKDLKEYLYSLPSQTGFRKEHDPGMIVSRAYSERLRELTAVQPIPPEQTAKLHAWGHKELDAFKFYRDQETKKYQRNIDYVKKEKKDFEELTDKLNKDPENKTLRWNWRQARKTLETNLSRMPYWEQAIKNYESPEWLEKYKDTYREKYIKEVKEAISKGKPVPAEVIAQHHEFRKARDARERYEKGWKTSFANVSAAVVEGTKETTGVKVKRQDGKPITKQQIEEIASGLKDIQDVIGNIMPVMKTENITVAHTSGKYPFLSQAGGMYHPSEKSVTMGIAGTNATAHEIAHFLDDVAKTQIPQTEPKYDLKLIGEASARINNYYGVDRMLSLSPKKTKEEKEAARLLRAHLGSYWRRQEEIFARLVEQYIAFKNQKSSTAYNPLPFYEKTPGWWTHDDFLQLLPMVEAELKRKLDLAYKKVGMTSALAPLPVHVAAAPVIKSDVKQPWEMTLKEYIDMRSEHAGAFDFGFPQYHKSHVEEAIKQGLPVPEKVLKEYPDLMNLKKNPGDIIGDKPNPIMKQQLLKLWKQLLGAEDIGDFETFMKEVSDLTYHEAKEKLLKTYGSPKGKEGEKAAKAEAQACDYAMEQCNEGVNEACTTACQDCHIKEACEKAPIDMTGLVEDKTGERTSRLRIDSGALKGKTAFRCPECFRGLTKTDKGLVCGEHGLIPLTGTIQVGSHTLGHALDLRQIGKDKTVTKQAKETYAWFLEEAKEAGFKTVKEYYDSLKDKERDGFKEYARLGVGLEEMFSKSKKPEMPAKSDLQVLNDWLNNADIETPEGVEKYKSDWHKIYKEIYNRLPKPDQDMIFSRLTGITQYIYDKKKEAEAKILTETSPTDEVKEWAKKAHGITDYKGIRNDRIGMLRYILYKGEIGNLRDRNEALSMAIALGKDLGYGAPPASGKSLERYYAEKIANETGKDVPILMGSSVVTPVVQALPVEEKMKEAETEPVKGTEFIPNKSLINKQLADRSHMGTSFDPEKRAEQEISGFVQDIQNVYNDLKRYAKTPAQKALLIEEMQKFQAGYAQKYNEKLSAHGNTISSFITGGSKFPTRRAEKANASYDKRFQEMIDWKHRAQKAIIRKLKGEAIEEAGGEIPLLEKKLKDLEKLQEMMVQANKIIRKKHEPGIEGVSKHKQLVDLGFSEKQASELLVEDFAGRKGFTYHLQNNNQEIHRLRDRIAQLQRKEVTETREFAFTGGNIVDNQKDDRVQIFFDQKPAQDVISKLKSEGWHWTPSIGAWQRKRTEYALMSANRITGAQAETQFEKSEPARTESKPETVTGTENWFDKSVEKIQQWSESGTMMGLISKDEAINLIKSGRYRIVNGVAVTELPTIGHEKAIPVEEAEARIRKALAEEKKEKPKPEPKKEYTPTAIISALAKQRAAEWFKAQTHNPYERYYLYHRIGDFLVSNAEPPGYTISHPERISPAWTVDQAANWIFNTSLKLPILPLEAVPPVAIVHNAAPEEKKIDVQWIFDKYTDGFNDASIRAVTMISDEALASGLRHVAPELSKEEALRIAPQVKELAHKKAPPLPKPESKTHIETMEEYRDRKAKIWSEIQREPIRDIKVEIQVNRDQGKGREYPHVYVIKTAVTDKGEVKLDETIYKGSSEIKAVQNKGVEGYRREELYRVGKPLSDSIDKRYFTEYSDLAPKPMSGTLDTIPERPEVKKEPEYKRPEYELEQWTALYAPHLNTWSWNYYVKGFSSWWQKVFGTFKELKEFLQKGESVLWVHGVRGDEKVKWTPKTLTEPKLLKQTGTSRVRGDTLYSLEQPYFNSLDDKWVWRANKGLLKTGELTPGDVDEAELLNAKEFTEAQIIENRIARDLEKYCMDDYSKAEIGILWFVPDLVRDLIKDAQKLPKATSEKYISILEDMRARAIAERNKWEEAEKEKEKPVEKPPEPARTEPKVEPAKTGAQKEAEKVLRIDLDKYYAYEWGTRVKLIAKQAAKGEMKDVLATGHLSDEEYKKVKPFIKGVQQPRKPLKPIAQFVAKPDKFFINAFDIDTDKHSFEEVEGKPITIKGFEGHDLFLHKTKGAAGYSITEGRSGTSIVRGIKTEKEARLEAENVLNKFKGTIDKKIAEAVRIAGLSPRYTTVELKRRVEKLVEKPSGKPEPKVEKAVEKAVVAIKPEHKPEPKPEPKPDIRVEPVHIEPKKPARAKKSVKKFAKKFIKTEYGRAIIKKAKADVIRLTSDDLKADVIILRG